MKYTSSIMHGTVKYFWGCIILQCGRTHPPTLPCNTNYFCKNIRTPPFQLKDSDNFLLHFLKIIFHVTMKWNDRSANTSNKKLKIFPCQFTKRQNNISQKLTWALSHKIRYFCFLFLTDIYIFPHHMMKCQSFLNGWFLAEVQNHYSTKSASLQFGTIPLTSSLYHMQVWTYFRKFRHTLLQIREAHF